ncbi:MAG TPA: hypothetical protein PK348_04955 [Spirochaetota bacterium]|nr:hypothetical protein [Spirochaetota bacterium]
MKYTVKLIFAVLVCLTMVSFGMAAENLDNRTRDIGLYGGVLLPGTISIEDADEDTEMGFTLKAYFDQFVSPMFSVGVYGQYAATSTDSPEIVNPSVDVDVYEFGLTFKPKFMISPTAAIKPGLEIGYRSTTVDLSQPGIDTSADGLALNFSAELQFALDGGYLLGLTFGFLAQPTGGTDDADVTWAPIWYAMAGIVF